MSTIRIGIVGLGANCRLQHVPRLRACENVEICGVVNRRPESTAFAAQEFNIPKTYEHWEQLIADPEIDAVVIGTWPYLHCPITLAALNAGKHVLTEARMAMNASEGRQMYKASLAHSDLVTQIVPSPIGFEVDRVIKEMIADGYLGQLREVVVVGSTDGSVDEDVPLHWRHTTEYSGLNMLFLGIVHETLTRWVPHPRRVFAQTHTFTPERKDPVTDGMVPADVPDSVQILTVLPLGARGIYHISGAIRFGPALQIHLYGSEGTIKFLSEPAEHLLAARKNDTQLHKIDIPADKVYSWRVEQDFVNAIHGKGKIELTDFATGVHYMEFTEAVAQSAESGAVMTLE